MSLDPGTRIGPYEITGQLGAGGMGEVCRARDTKLNREVALKVLPEAFATDPDRMARFQREAQLLAALNHPNIAAIHGLEDGGARQAIVMELVDGRALAGPLPIPDALPIAKQIADAIEYAHDRGIIHRDLKPANIKVTPDGAVKVLDFGLAKAMDDSTDPVSNVLATMSPTLSLAATHAGVILGTAAYMAPEQAKGKPADRRADIWAFGIVLYEMLTGAPVFGGDSVPETLASVMKDPIAFGKLPDDTPPPIRRLVARCLERDPRRRLQSIGEARIVLEDVIAGVAESDRPQPAPAAAAPGRWPWMVAAGVATLIALGTLAWGWSRPAPTPPGLARYTIAPPDGTTLTATRAFASTLALSPDGRYIAFIADEQGRERTLWVRAINSLTAQRLDRTEEAMYPFWSPDSQHIAYFAKGKLMRVALAGGAPLAISDAPDGEGGAWYQPPGQDGIIVFAGGQNGPLQRVLAQGGVATAVTKLAANESGHIFPQFLPDGRFLFLVRGATSGVYVQSLDSTDRKFVTKAIGRVLFSPPGLLLYLRDNTLLAHRWNLATLELEGEPVLVADDVRSGGANARNAFTVSANGVLAYRAGGTGRFQFTWYTHEGKPDGTVLEAGENGPFELSPDNTRLVVEIGTGDDRDLWLKDLASGALSRITSAAGSDRNVVWSPDSRRIAFNHFEGSGNKTALLQTLIGSGTIAAVEDDTTQTFVHEWTSDGKSLLTSSGGSLNLVALPAEDTSTSAPSKPKALFTALYATSHFHTSPDGKWIAYTSQESGMPQVVIATFPGFTDRRQISINSSTQPLWRADGRELFFLQRDQKLMAVEITTRASTLDVGPIRTLFPIGPGTIALTTRNYAVTRDGRRFLIREVAGTNQVAAEQLHITMNWTSLVGQ